MNIPAYLMKNLLRFFIFSILFGFLLKNNTVAQEPHPKPNIILICADDLGWSDLGCYGSEIKTPNLDKLAETGMRFTQFYNTSKCFPSRACLLTGVYAQQCNYHESSRNPIVNAVTIGEVLQDAGYRTLWSGKHHGLENPVYRGFNRYYGLKSGACNYFNPGKQRPGEGKPARKGPVGNRAVRSWCFDSMMYNPYTPEDKDFYTTDYFTNYSLTWLEEYKDEEKPFFLYLAYTAPHDPLMAWPEDIARYEGKYDEGYEKIRKKRYKKQLSMGLLTENHILSDPTHDSWSELSENEKKDERRKMEVYAAMIDRMDWNIGRILKKLEEIGKFENSLIMFVSDNGASNVVAKIEGDYGEIGTMTRWASLGENWANVGNTPFRFYKNYSYEGGINTPLIAWWPEKIAPGSVSRFQGHFIDFMPTLVELTGAKYPKVRNGQKITPLQGQSILPVLKGEDYERENPLYWEWRQGQAVLHKSWKLVRHGLQNPWDLYNLKTDPTETNNLAADNQDKVKELETFFQNWKYSLPVFSEN